MAFQKKTFVWHIGWYSKNLIAYYTLEQNLFYYFFSDYNSFAEILLSFRCRFEGCIFFINTRQPVLEEDTGLKTPHTCAVFSYVQNTIEEAGDGLPWLPCFSAGFGEESGGCPLTFHGFNGTVNLLYYEFKAIKLSSPDP